MRFNFFKYIYSWLLCKIHKWGFVVMLCACMFFLPTWDSFSANNDPLPVTRGEIIRDIARITFEWSKPIEFTVQAKDKIIHISFERRVNPDVGAILSSLYPYITNIERKPDGKTIILALDKPYKVRKFVSHNISGIDLLGIKPEIPQVKIAKKENIEKEIIEKENPIYSFEEGITQGRQGEVYDIVHEPKHDAGENLNQTSIMPLLPLESGRDNTEITNFTASNSAGNLAELAPAAGEEEKIDTDGIAQPDSESTTPAPTEVNKVTISSADDSATLRFPLSDRTAFAVFTRNHHLWIVLGQPIKLDLSEFKTLAKTVMEKPEIIANPKATILYIPIDDSVYVSATKEDGSNNIAILITQKKMPVASPLQVEVSTSPPAPPHVLISTLEMADTISVNDPMIGDTLIITPLFNIGEGVTSSREFIEFDLLETAQGIVAIKKSDDVTAVQLRNGLRITTKKGATISPGLPKLDTKASGDGIKSNNTLFPYEMWKVDATESRRKQLQKLFHQIVETENAQDANNARLRMAQIYLSEGMAPEAIALIDGINRTNPSFYRTTKLNALRGAANFLMTRFIESAKDFAATELNNNKEIEYWRAVLSDLLGNTGQTYDYLAMNEDYISKYPPVFRQRLAIVAADRAISAKEYNIALKIFDSLHHDNLLDSINAYINFLMAKISMSTGQEKEATENLDKLAEDIKHPFVMARAEFTRIARDLDADMDKDNIIDRLERLRLNWHGDNLELQVLVLLGDLYYEKKDYVNAMRIWNNGVHGFRNTSSAIDMARKMEEVFIIMFNDGVADTLQPLEALALYYEYRNYMPGGTAGNEMINRLAERLISVDLLEQAASLLDHQMRTQTEKEARSYIGTKLASIYLLNHQPQKALSALQDSVYGENPVLLRLRRNRLVAEAMVDMDKPDLAIQTLGQDDSPEAESIRIKIYWKTKDWAKLTASIEYILKTRPDITADMTLDESEYLLKLALAYIFTDNKEHLQYLHDYFGPLMAKSPNRQVFEFITSPDIAPNSRNFDEVIKSINNTRSFIENYRVHTGAENMKAPTK